MKIEYSLQSDIIKFLDNFYPNLKRVVNVAERSHNVRAGVLNKKLGYQAGTPDMILLKANNKYHGLCIELKSATGRLSKSQIDFDLYCKENNYYFLCSSSYFEVVDIIKKYMENRL